MHDTLDSCDSRLNTRGGGRELRDVPDSEDAGLLANLVQLVAADMSG